MLPQTTQLQKKSVIHQLCIIRYYEDDRPWDEQKTRHPSWSQVESAIQQMDNRLYPIVQLNCTEYEDDEDIFNIIGGAGRWTLFQMMGKWKYHDPNKGSNDVMLWESDQGYSCQECNVLTDIEKVLRITYEFFQTGSYTTLDHVR